MIGCEVTKYICVRLHLKQTDLGDALLLEKISAKTNFKVSNIYYLAGRNSNIPTVAQGDSKKLFVVHEIKGQIVYWSDCVSTSSLVFYQVLCYCLLAFQYLK